MTWAAVSPPSSTSAARAWGDPACDLVVAYTLLSATTRPLFRTALGLDDATWARGMGWALTTALNAYTSYAATEPRVARQTTRQLTEVLTEHAARSTRASPQHTGRRPQFGMKREADSEGRPPSGRRVDLDPPRVRGDQGIDDGQSQPGAARRTST